MRKIRIVEGDKRMMSEFYLKTERDKIVQVVRLAGCKNFVGQRQEEFIFNAFIYLETVQNLRMGLI